MKSVITDLAVELLRRIPRHSGGITVNTTQFGGAKITATQITNAAGAEQIGKPVGTYINIECAADSDISAVLTRELKKIIRPRRLLGVPRLGVLHDTPKSRLSSPATFGCVAQRHTRPRLRRARKMVFAISAKCRLPVVRSAAKHPNAGANYIPTEMNNTGCVCKYLQRHSVPCRPQGGTWVCRVKLTNEAPLPKPPPKSAGEMAGGAAGETVRGSAGARILAVGLGNDRFVADSLGPLALSYIRTGEKMMTFEPNVKGITGINSVDAIKQIAALCRPDFVIAVDGLVSASADRIGRNYQIATTGITPGSGICRDNKRLDEEFLRIPVIAVGVPVCTVIEDGKGNTLHATVKEIDRMVLLAAQNIAGGINGLG